MLSNKTIVMIHGAWHGAWSLERVKKLLEQKGYNVIAPDLPGLGKDTTSPESVTMKMYIDFVVNIINQLPDKVLLLGHSLAGIIISQVAEQIPDKIEKLIYLCAFYTQNSESLMDIVAKYPNGNKLDFDFYADKVFGVKEHLLEPVFYNECSEQDIALAKQLLKPQAMEPFNAKTVVTKERYGRVPRIYIECTKDQGIPIEVQRMMVQAEPCKVYTLETDHSPFFSTPEALVDIIAN